MLSLKQTLLNECATVEVISVRSSLNLPAELLVLVICYKGIIAEILQSQRFHVVNAGQKRRRSSRIRVSWRLVDWNRVSPEQGL